MTRHARSALRPGAARIPGRRATGLLLAGLLALAPLLGGCTTARQRDEPRSMLGNLRFRDGESRRHFHQSYRSGNLYQDWRPVLVVDAIFKDEAYRRMFIDLVAERFYLDPAEVRELRREQQQAFDSHFEFLVLIYGGTNDPVRLTRADAQWRLFLRDDDGDLLRPESTTAIEEDSPTHLYLKAHFIGVDRWSEIYRVTFPKLEKSVVPAEIGTHPFQLIVSGVQGTVTMEWERPETFYRSDEGSLLASQDARGAPSPAP